MSPAVPFQVCPVSAVRACYGRCVIGVCIRVINVQEKGILQNERLFFIISLKEENGHSLLSIQNTQHPNWNIRKTAAIKQKNQEIKKIHNLRTTQNSLHLFLVKKTLFADPDL